MVRRAYLSSLSACDVGCGGGGGSLNMPQLIQPAKFRSIPGLAVPHDFYWVLQQPTPLAGMAYPRSRTPWSAMASLGLRHVVNVAAQGPIYDPAPLAVTHTTPLEDLY